MTEEFEILKGKTLFRIDGRIGDEQMDFFANDGLQYRLYYDHD